MTNHCDRNILRDLARRVRHHADAPEMEVLRERWRRHNSLETRGAPLVVVWPECGWEEVLPKSSLRCENEFHRRIEWALRAKIYQREMINDDSPIEPWFDLGWKVSVGSYGMEIPRTQGERRGSFVWDAPIKDLNRDLGKLKPREFTVDREATRREVGRASELIEDILPVRARGSYWWTMGLTQDASYLVGLEQLMLAMCDEPENVHRLMAFLRDDAIRYIEWCEREGLLSDNAEAGDMIASGGYGALGELRKTPASEPARLSDRWGFAEAQETVGISPGMFEEFVLPYQAPILEKFGLNCYGCCEGLEHRIGMLIKQVPRLRRVSVAPMANQEAMAEKMRDAQCIFSRKAQPTHVCVGFNEPAIRADLWRTLRVAKGLPLELILKDTHTVENDPGRFGRWVRIAREEIERLN